MASILPHSSSFTSFCRFVLLFGHPPSLSCPTGSSCSQFLEFIYFLSATPFSCLGIILPPSPAASSFPPLRHPHHMPASTCAGSTCAPLLLNQYRSFNVRGLTRRPPSLPCPVHARLSSFSEAYTHTHTHCATCRLRAQIRLHVVFLRPETILVSACNLDICNMRNKSLCNLAAE